MLSPKRERFCQEFVKCDNGSEAYRAAYNTENYKPESIWTNASNLLANAKVKQRVAELKAEIAERTMVTLVQLNSRNEEIWAIAKNDEDLLAMQKNVESAAKLNGLIIDRSKVESKIDLGTHEEYIKEIKAIADAAKS